MDDDIDGAANLLWIRARMVASRIVQVLGFYLVAAATADIFGVLTAVPGVVTTPYAGLDVSPVFIVPSGLAIIWLSTSVWFLAPSRQ